MKLHYFLPLLLLLLIPFTPHAKAETYNITLTTIYDDLETGMNTLIEANCTDSGGFSHGGNVTFAVNGVSFHWNNGVGAYCGTTRRGTPTTITLSTVTAFHDKNNVSSTATVITSTSVTWVDSRFSNLKPYMATGDYGGILWEMATGTIGGLAFFTFMVSVFGLAVYNFNGWKSALLVLVLSWGTWSTVVHGEAVTLLVFFISLSMGILIAKVYFDRRNSF